MEKRGESALDAFFLRWLHASGRFGTFCVPKCRTIPFFGCFLESCYIVHPRTRADVPEKPVRGYEIGGKTAFRQEKCCTIRNLPRKSESCNKIRRFLPWVLISWQVLAAWCPLQAWCLDGEARGSVAGAGPADRDRGGDRVRERLDHARPAHGVRGALRQEPVRPTFEGYSRRRDHARPQPKELIPRD
jgi:hypothetical protein